MPVQVRVIQMRQKAEPSWAVVNACSNAPDGYQRQLSPFILGPCPLYDGMISKNMENAWQFSKLYACHADSDGNPTSEYWKWAKEGWAMERAVRYPMGKGAKPLCSLWEGKRYGYVEARKRIYGPLYRDALLRGEHDISTSGWSSLKSYYNLLNDLGGAEVIAIRDYDGYDHVNKGMTLTAVLNLPSRKMGHAFVLAMMLTGDPALHQLHGGAT